MFMSIFVHVYLNHVHACAKGEQKRALDPWDKS